MVQHIHQGEIHTSGPTIAFPTRYTYTFISYSMWTFFGYDLFKCFHTQPVLIGLVLFLPNLINLPGLEIGKTLSSQLSLLSDLSSVSKNKFESRFQFHNINTILIISVLTESSDSYVLHTRYRHTGWVFHDRRCNLNCFCLSISVGSKSQSKIQIQLCQ